MLRLLSLSFAVLLFLEAAASAAEVRLKDGTRLRGHIGAQSETAIYFVPDKILDFLEPRLSANASGPESVSKLDVLKPGPVADAPGRESVLKPDVLEPRWISISEIESIQLDPVLVDSASPRPARKT